MKAATRVILLLKDGADDGGFASSISNALQPNPNSNLRRLEESFELSLEKYGIKDHKASGNMIHFLNSNGVSEVSVLLLEHIEPPLLACALNEVLVSFLGGTSSDIPNLVVPFLVEASKLKLENKNAISSYEVSLLLAVAKEREEFAKDNTKLEAAVATLEAEVTQVKATNEKQASRIKELEYDVQEVEERVDDLCDQLRDAREREVKRARKAGLRELDLAGTS
nr:uncharacterized protein LOC113689161 [Coffea arabica]